MYGVSFTLAPLYAILRVRVLLTYFLIYEVVKSKRCTALTLLAMPPTKTRFGMSMPNFGAGDMRAELTVSRLGQGEGLPDTAALAYQRADKKHQMRRHQLILYEQIICHTNFVWPHGLQTVSRPGAGTAGSHGKHKLITTVHKKVQNMFNMLCTSNFVHGVMFSHYGANRP